jgi:hypothetical protein
MPAHAVDDRYEQAAVRPKRDDTVLIILAVADEA